MAGFSNFNISKGNHDGDLSETWAGEKRNTYEDGTAEILVVDFFRHLWADYSDALPEGRRVLYVADTKAAKQAMEQNPHIKVVVIQGMARRTEDDIFSESFGTTAVFIDDLLETGWPWRVFVVSRMFKDDDIERFERMARAQVWAMGKGEFFERAPRLLGRVVDMPLVAQTVRRSLRQQMREAGRIGLRADATREDGQMWRALESAYHTFTRLDDVIVGGNPESILRFIANDHTFFPLDGSCICRARRRETTEWWNWLHANHCQMNLALWQALAADSDILELVALELEADLQTQGALPYHGRITQKVYGRKLLAFLRSGGSDPAWV